MSNHAFLLSLSATLLTTVAIPVLAQATPYTDVPSGAYYEEAALSLRASGALDSSLTTLRPADLATRAELVKLLVSVNRTPLVNAGLSSFNDISMNAWYHAYFETAAKMLWIRGDGDCYANFRPCTARPSDGVNRAEAAALLVRTFGVRAFGTAPTFADNASYQWYFSDIQSAADNCIVQGDSSSDFVRPGARMNRAEMVVMFYRATQNMRYGRDCGTLMPSDNSISSIAVLSANSLRVTFTTDMNRTSVENIAHFSIVRASDGASATLRSVTQTSSRTVEIVALNDFNPSSAYTLIARNVTASDGKVFNGNARFVSLALEANSIVSTVTLTSRIVRLTFASAIDKTSAEMASHYTVSRIGVSGTIAVQSAVFLDSQNVELHLASDLILNASYKVSGTNLLTIGGSSFSDSDTTVFTATKGSLVSVTAVSAKLLRLTFDTNLDPSRAEESNRYLVSDGDHTVIIRTPNLLGTRIVELTTVETMQNQRAYTVNVSNMLTSQGVIFDASGSTVLGTDSASFKAQMSGAKEVPPVVTSATGSGIFTLLTDGLHYDIRVTSLSGAITAAHLHLGDKDIAGPVLTSLIFSGNRSVGVWTSITNEQRNALLDGNVYVNIHTLAHPDGEIRGQLMPQ